MAEGPAHLRVIEFFGVPFSFELEPDGRFTGILLDGMVAFKYTKR